MNTTPPAILAETVFDIQEPHGASPIAIELAYNSDDPFAVTMRFFVRPGEAVTWLLSRSLLAEGLRTPSGLGDVRISPLDPDTCLMELCSENGAATFHAPVRDLQRFLGSSYELVPRGQECIDFDRELEILAATGEYW
jgi:hypothetical protein